MLNSSRLVLIAAAGAAASQERTGPHDASEEEQSDPDNKQETATPQAAAVEEEEEEAEDAYADGAVEDAYDLEDINEVLAELEEEGVDDSDSSDIVLTDSSAPSYVTEDHWEDVTKEVCVDEELARLGERDGHGTEPPQGRRGPLDGVDSKVSSVDEVDNNEGGDYYKNLVSKTLSQERENAERESMSVVEAGGNNIRGKVTFSPSPPSGAPTPFAAESAREHNVSTPTGAGKRPPPPPPEYDSEEQRGRRRASLRIRLKNNGDSRGGDGGGDRAKDGAEGVRGMGAGAGEHKKKTWTADSNFRETINSTETFRVRESVKTTRSTRDKEEEERRSSDYSRETVSCTGGDSGAVVTTKEDSSESASYSETTKPPRSILKKVSSYEHCARSHPPPPPPPPPPRPTAKSAAPSPSSPSRGSSPPQPPPPLLPPKAEEQFRDDFSRRAIREKEEGEKGTLTPPGAGRVHGWQPRRQQQRQQQLRTGEAPASQTTTTTTTAPDSVKFLGGRSSRGGGEGEGRGGDGSGCDSSRGDFGQAKNSFARVPNKARDGGGGRVEGLAAESAPPAATGSTAGEAEPSASALAEAAAGKTLPNVTSFRGDVGGDVAEGQEEVHGDEVHVEERAAGDDQDAPGGADVVVVVKKRKKSKKDKVSGKKEEGKKRERPKARSPSPEPEEQGSVSGGAVRGGEEGGGRYAGSLALGGDYGERPGPASFSPAKSDGKSVGGGGGGGGGGSRSEVVKVLLRKDSGLRSSLDEAEATDAADDDVLLSVIRDIDRGSLGRGLPALPAAPPPPPPLSASPKIDPPEVPPKSSGVRKQASSAKDAGRPASRAAHVEAAPKLPPRQGATAEDDAVVPRVPPKKKKANKKASGRSAHKPRSVKRPALQPVPEDGPVEPLPLPVQRVKIVSKDLELRKWRTSTAEKPKVVKVTESYVADFEGQRAARTNVERRGRQKSCVSTSDREGVDALDVLLDDDGKVEAESKIDIETKRGTEEEAANQSEPDGSLGIKSAASRRTSSSSNNQTIPEEMDVLAANSNCSTGAGIHVVGRHRLSMDTANNDPAPAGLGGLLPPPPTYSRLPPDGHEFPQDYRDPHTGFTVQQQQQLLSRKSSASSTSSLEKPHHRLRHDEHSMKSVKDKIALFSTSSTGGLHQSTEDVNNLLVAASAASTAAVGSSNMTRAYTHSDVRYEQRSNGRGAHVVHRVSSGGGGANATSVLEQRRPNVKSVSSADLTSHNRRITMTHSSRTRPPSLSAAAGGAAGGRSQSLLEIGRAAAAPAPGLAKRASLTGANEASDARQISLPPAPSGQRLSLSTPPWKSGQSRYSPAFKRKPFAVYSTGNVKSSASTTATSASAASAGVSPLRRRNATATADDSDTDSAVSSGRSSISHSSVSPPPAPSSAQQHENRRVLKKNSVEAINRRNVLNACKKSSGSGGAAGELRQDRGAAAESQSGPGISSRSASITSLGKPASRSSSFTIAERKKSFESRNNATTNETSSGTDSRRGSIASTASSTAALDSALPRRSASRDAVFESGSASSATDSRRSSRDTIAGDVEEGGTVIGRSEADGGSRVTTPTKQQGSSDRSSSVTPTGGGGGAAESSSGRRVVSRNNSITSDRSTYSNAETKSSYARSSSVVSKDSGLAEEDANKWSLLEKKYSANSNGNSLHSGDTKNRIAKFAMEPTERPKELSVKKNSLSSATCTKTAAAPSGASSIRELTERFESNSASSSRRESVVSNASSVFDSSTCSASSVLATPTNNPAFRIGDKTFITSNWLEDKSPAMYLPEESTEWESFDPSTPFTPPMAARNVNNNSLKPHVPKDRKFSVPIYSEAKDEDGRSNEVKMRDKKSQNAAPSRPSSLIETSTMGAGELKVFEIGNLGERQNVILSNSTSRGSSQADLLTDAETSLIHKSPLLLPQPSSSSASSSKPGSVTGVGVSNVGGSAGGAGGGVGSAGGAGTKPGSAGGSDASRRCVSVNDIRRAFEKAEASLSNSLKAASTCSSNSAPSHNRMSSLDSTTSDESSSIPQTPHYYGSVNSLLSGGGGHGGGSGGSNLKDHYGSITSLASSTSLISPQELQGLIDEANMSLEESGTPSHEIMVIVLHREFTSGSTGITLAGGADYECKDITVHKVIPGTLADRDGRIQKGDRVLSINGRSTKGVNHREALSILKAPRAELVLVLSRSRSVTPAENGSFDRSGASSGDYAAYSYVNMNSNRPPKILESPLDSKSLLSDLKFVDVPRGPPMTVVLKKEGTGLGFSLEGGKDSPLGDRPLTIKKIFTGGAADKSKVLKVGDEIIAVNSTDCTRMSRIEAWNFMKKLSDGTANLFVRQKIMEKPVALAASATEGKTPATPTATVAATAKGGEDTAAKVDRTVEETKHI